MLGDRLSSACGSLLQTRRQDNISTSQGLYPHSADHPGENFQRQESQRPTAPLEFSGKLFMCKRARLERNPHPSLTLLARRIRGSLDQIPDCKRSVKLTYDCSLATQSYIFLNTKDSVGIQGLYTSFVGSVFQWEGNTRYPDNRIHSGHSQYSIIHTRIV